MMKYETSEKKIIADKLMTNQITHHAIRSCGFGAIFIAIYRFLYIKHVCKQKYVLKNVTENFTRDENETVYDLSLIT